MTYLPLFDKCILFLQNLIASHVIIIAGLQQGQGFVIFSTWHRNGIFVREGTHVVFAQNHWLTKGLAFRFCVKMKTRMNAWTVMPTAGSVSNETGNLLVHGKAFMRPLPPAQQRGNRSKRKMQRNFSAGSLPSKTRP